MFFRLCLFLVGFFPICAIAQKATIDGIVQNVQGEPVQGVIIREKASRTNGTATDEKGHFTLLLDAGQDVLVIFKAVAAEEIMQSFNLKPGEVKEVVITYNDTYTTPTLEFIDSRKREEGITRIETKFKSSLPTINQGIEAYLIQAPVNVASELSSSYSVRGGSFDENLVYVNDIQVYRPFLARAGEQEGLSFPNPDMVQSIDFSSGGFQAKFGDKMSSVLDIQYARPDSFSGKAQIGLLGGQLQLSDISKNRKWTYNSGFRHRDYSYILKTLDVTGDYKPRFSDWQNYITFRPKGEFGPWEISLLTNFSSNRYNFVPQDRQTDVGTINEALRLSVYFDGQEITQFQTYFGALSMRYNPSPTSQLKLIASAFQTYESEHFSVLGAYRLDELERDLGSDKFGEVLTNRGIGGFLKNGRNDLNATVYSLSHKGFKEIDYLHHLIQWGADYQIERIHDQLNEWQLVDSAGYASTHPGDSIGYTNSSAQGTQLIPIRDRIRATNDVYSQRISGYVQDTYKKKWSESGSSFSATVGLRANHWTYNGQTVVSPRLNMAYTPNWMQKRKDKDTGAVDSVKKDIVLTASVGYYYQPPFYREMRGFDGKVNPNIRAQRSIHYIVGADYIFHAWDRPFKFVAQAYYKQLNSLIPYELDNVRQRYFATNNAHGYATGVDLMLNGEFIKGVQSWLRASVMKTAEDLTNDYYFIYLNNRGDTIYPGYTLNNVAVDSIKQIPGYIPRPTDQRFSFSMLFQDQMPKKPQYKVLLNMFFATGLPYGPPTRQRYLDVSRTRAYFRTDIGFSRDLFYTKKKNNAFNRNIEKGSISLEVFNLLDVKNIINHQWIEDVSGKQYGIPTYLTGRRINLRFSISF